MIRWVSALLAAALAGGSAPPAPDYDAASAWIARPARRAAVDVFYIHPTTTRSTRWNQDVAASDPAERGATDAIALRQASAFARCCDLYAPRYRQASPAAFAAMAEGGAQAFAIAYGDVERAFDHYLAHNPGRPFILAGHSQGALHALTLLERRIAGTPLRRRLVAAYVVGIGVPLGFFGRALGDLPACAAPQDTGCVASWNAFREGSDVSAYLARQARRYTDRYGPGEGAEPLCTNPLTFDAARPAATSRASRGALLGVAGDRAPARQAHAVAAACRGGVLFVDVSRLRRAPLLSAGGSLHNDEFALFHADLAADAARRIAAFRNRERRALRAQ